MNTPPDYHGPQILAAWRRHHTKPVNVNKEFKDQLSPLDRLAASITDKVVTMGFFFMIFVWTILWCGYNIIATEIPGFHLHPFDPFPAFVAYLLISNVIQILLMPLIMVGQSVQGKHSELRAENDFEINQKAEHEVEAILYQLQFQQQLIMELIEAQNLSIEEVLKKVTDHVGPPPSVHNEEVGPSKS